MTGVQLEISKLATTNFNILRNKWTFCYGIIVFQGELLWPPPKIADPTPVASAQAAKVVEPPPPRNYFKETLTDAFMYTAGLSGILGKW